MLLIILITNQNERMGNVLQTIKTNMNLSDSFDEFILQILNKLRVEETIKQRNDDLISNETLIGDIILNPKIESYIFNEEFIKLDTKKKYSDFELYFNPIYGISFAKDKNNYEEKLSTDNEKHFWELISNKDEIKRKISEEIDNKINGSKEFNNDRVFVYEINPNLKSLEPILYKNENKPLQLEIVEDDNKNLELKLLSDDSIELFKYFQNSKNQIFNTEWLLKQVFSSEIADLKYESNLNILDFYKDNPTKNIRDILLWREKIRQTLFIMEKSNLTIINNTFKIIGFTNQTIKILNQTFGFKFMGYRDLNEKENSLLFNLLISEDFSIKNIAEDFKTVLNDFIVKNTVLFKNNLQKSIFKLYEFNILNTKEISQIIDKNAFINVINQNPSLLNQMEFRNILWEIISNNDREILRQIQFEKIEKNNKNVFDLYLKQFERHIISLNQIGYLSKTQFYKVLEENKRDVDFFLKNQSFHNYDIQLLEAIYYKHAKLKENISNNSITIADWNHKFSKQYNNLEKIIEEKYRKEINFITSTLRQELEKVVKKEVENKLSFKDKIQNKELQKEISRKFGFKEFNVQNIGNWWSYLSNLIHNEKGSFDGKRIEYHFLTKEFAHLLHSPNTEDWQKQIWIKFNEIDPNKREK
ncbi:hypothetical protein U5U50_03100 [Mycoplasma sp. 888]|uniref:hypothetical protein n=1 Tax=Mycoplasma sp. 888 TaxID=3108483 RepID=UPI002D79CF40|nr:hypothetical protein [Mycoplasma sp. 888]WRQ25768.1 hypothetical protein U5U50_03100 [Mycoplasma sp. 888]